ncbi:MAG: matrixin family metalloprotease [Deltaproteobacteria bacterium]|nr:matrixin family metalloprotease [Deltaproteobacteria bacterium]
MLRWGNGPVQTAGVAVLLLLLASQTASAGSVAPAGARQAHRWAGRPAAKPAYLWLWYADGKTMPPDMSCCDGVPPAFACDYKATANNEATTDPEVCKRQVQEHLDLWYADFNLVFTLSRPPTGDYYPIIITSDGGWCMNSVANICSLTPDEAGVAPFNCNDNVQLAAYAFACGYSAHDCAVLIAHEHGHLVGLEHTGSTSDIMNPTVMPTANGFDDRDNRTVVLDPTQLSCQVTQNSYQQMLGALGRWQASAKPSPFAFTPDAGTPDATPDAGAKDAADPATADGSDGNPGPGAVDVGEVLVVPGFDALTRPPLSTADASATEPNPKGGGCTLTYRAAPGSAVVAALGYLLAAGLIRCRVRRARRASAPLPCAEPAPWPSADRSRGCR